MKTKLALGAIVAAVAVFSQSAFAQASAPVTREQRKADTAEANKEGQLAKPGQGPGTTAKPSTATDKTRTERKAQTEADIKAGKVAPAGNAKDMKADQADAARPTQASRDARKAQTAADVKSGKTAAPGQAAEQK